MPDSVPPHATPPLAVAKPGGRAGRDLPAAIAVGASLGGLVIATLFLLRPAFTGLVALAAVIGVRELSNALGRSTIRIGVPAVLAGGVTTVALGYALGADGAVLALAGTAVAAALWSTVRQQPRWQRDALAGVLAAVYVPYLASFATVMASSPDGARRVVTFVATVVASDIGGYAIGVLSGGRHKLAPKISPGKSWEGFAGSVVTCGVVGLILASQLLHTSVWQGLVFGLVMAPCAVVGDLAESLLKRRLGVKDMGTLLPGHGGLLDRLDSLLVAAPVAWVLLRVFT